MTQDTWTLTRDFGIGFFDSESTKALIEMLASSPALTIFVGAGASTDQGMPTWKKLVSQLFEGKIAHLTSRRSARSESEATNLKAIADYLTDAYQETPTASIVDGMYRRDQGDDQSGVSSRNRDIANILYDPSPGAWGQPVYLAKYIVVLCGILKQFGVDIQIATTNYDDSLETYTRRDEVIANWLDANGLEFLPFTSLPGAVGDNVVPVVHLHGYVPRDGTPHGVVFSELDYVEASETGLLQAYLHERLAGGGHVLCVGSSLRDEDLVGALVRARKMPDAAKHAHVVALVPIHEELKGLPRGALKDVRSDVRDYYAIRGEQLGISIYRPDFYGQVYQFLQEIALAKVSDDQYQPYDRRLRTWWRQWEAENYDVEPVRREVTLGLEDLVIQYQQELARICSVMKIEVWARTDPDKRVFELWCSSQSMWLRRDGHRPHTAPIDIDTKYAAVSSFALHTSLHGQVQTPGDRWSDYFAVPISLEEPPFDELPVGVVIAMFDHLDVPGDAELEKIRELEAAMKAAGISALLPRTR